MTACVLSVLPLRFPRAFADAFGRLAPWIAPLGDAPHAIRAAWQRA